MAIYQRGSGDHVAERVQPEPGSKEEQRLEKLVASREGGWYVVDAPKPAPESEPVVLERPAKSASKADWKAYAIQEGLDEDEAETATRDELAVKYADGGGS
ncbi:hypothetical protein ACFVGN_39385 [Streptomyces sp. NPDC057757]|uniref:hypothetical protein n=1 Tax=Streptomyces sp. NPDC057757 TaxID=3346241 RepID=UPI0036ACA3A9